MDLRERTDNMRRHPWEVVRAEFFASLITRHAAPAACRRVLDVGAGDGWLAGELSHDLLPDAEIVCWDAHYLSKDLATPQGSRIVRTSQRPTGSFDLVLVLDVLEHIEDDEEFFATQVVPALALGGVVVVSVPAHPALFADHDRMLLHHRRYRPWELRALVSRHVHLVAHGSLFSSLLAPRAGAVLLERAGRHTSPEGVGAWRHGPLLTSAVAGVLRADAAASRWSSDAGWPLPGLSTWVVARR